MKCTLCLNHIVSIPIQLTVEVKDSFPNKTVEIKKKQASTSGKFYNTNLMVEGSTLKYFNAHSLVILIFFFWMCGKFNQRIWHK